MFKQLVSTALVLSSASIGRIAKSDRIPSTVPARSSTSHRPPRRAPRVRARRRRRPVIAAARVRLRRSRPRRLLAALRLRSRPQPVQV